MASELFRQVQVLDPLTQTDQSADVWIADNAIRAIADHISDIPSDTVVHDGQGLVMGPGLVDLYSHSGEPGFESRETLLSLAQAGQAGGFTRLTILPDTHPPLDHLGSVQSVQTIYHQLHNSYPNLPILQIWGALTLKNQGDQMVELSEVATAAVGLAQGQSLENLALLRRLLEYLKPLDCPIALWPCDLSLRGDGVVREGLDAIKLGLPGDPSMSETSALAALLECVAEIGTPIHIMRVSTARSVTLIQQAKERGLPITASTTWMHVLLDTQALATYDPNLRVDPPLGNPADQAAIRQGLKSGVLDAIAIDHTPHTYEDKTVGFSETPPGTIGLELALPLLWHNLVENGDWSPLELWQCLSSQPAQCLQQPIPSLTIGQPAECILFDPQLTWQASESNLKSLSSNTPWFKQTIQGKVVQSWNPAQA